MVVIGAVIVVVVGKEELDMVDVVLVDMLVGALLAFVGSSVSPASSVV